VITRQQIADALSTVAGITGEALEPATKAAGQGWPVWRSTDVINGCDAMTVNWYVFVVLPGGDPNVPADAADPLVLPISRALNDIGGARSGLKIELIEPYQYNLGPDVSIPVLRYSASD